MIQPSQAKLLQMTYKSDVNYILRIQIWLNNIRILQLVHGAAL
jgi:hypothetical protein